MTPGTFSSQEQPGKPPSDAVILFDGTDVAKWEADEGQGSWLERGLDPSSVEGAIARMVLPVK